MKIRPINTDVGGLARCIKAGYYKMGWTNFTREILGAKDGFTAMATTGNKRLDAMLAVAVMSDLSGRCVLDCYMGRCIREDVCHTITTRTATDSNTWVLEINE